MNSSYKNKLKFNFVANQAWWKYAERYTV